MHDTSALMNQLEKGATKNKTTYVKTTFRYTRVINGHSVENLPAHVLDVRIAHRFGPINSGLYNFFGLDYSPFNVLIGFDYGLTNNFMIGGGHSAWQKTYDLFFKLKLLRQSSGYLEIPLTISFVPTVAFNKLRPLEFPVKPDSGKKIQRISYSIQLLIARKFSEGFSLQLMPTFLVADNISFFHQKRASFAIGIAGTKKLSKRMSFDAEYYYQLPGRKPIGSHNVLSFGIDIGTGGHVFELHFTNSIGLIEKSFITETTGRWDNGDARFGFNISRVFQLGKNRKTKIW
ncbi:MAG: DUF5777 family beta-barrel protein [Bacteroidota bacterium]|nr:DUF5777 family beta-barrel protein [Bacteroidota bacterium]